MTHSDPHLGYTLIMVVRETIIALAESKIKHKSCWHERC